MTDAHSTAMDLLLADRPSREDVAEAVSLLEQSSASGNPASTERLALIEAMGMVRPQDWGRSLDLLALAAEQGSFEAQQQLLLLSDNRADPDLEQAPDSWKTLRASIPLEGRIHAPPTTPLRDEPRLRLIRGFATPAECRFLIKLVGERVTPATVFDQKTGAQTYDSARNNSYFPMRLGEMSVFVEVIRARISSATRLPVPIFEPCQILHYSVGQQFERHHDFLDPANPAYREELARFGQRIATFLIYLNGDFEGGATSFPQIDFEFRPSEGDALFWANVQRDGRPDPLTLHAGLPPSAGEKWVLSQWIRDKSPGS